VLVAERAKEAHVPIHVLVAEDHELSRVLLKEIIELRGHRVTAVSNGREALEEMERRTFDLVLMDIHMPEMDGVQATAEVRRREHDGPHLPIVAVTAEAAPGFRERYMAAGFTDFMAKPIEPDLLYALIESLGKRPLAS
jgi:CheY-like chemotaxis protein